MTALMTIISCGRDQDRGCHDAIRDTYLKSWGPTIDHVFVVGRYGKADRPDEVRLDVDDHYDGVYQKMNAMCDSVYNAGYDKWFLCDVDTYVNVPRMLAATDGKEYVGWRCDEGHAGQGHGIWFGKRAIATLCAHPAGSNPFDLHAGNVLRQNKVALTHSPLFYGSMPKDWKEGITAHLGRGTGNYDPQWMREAHALST